MSEDSFVLHYHGGGGRATMKLGTVLSGGTDVKGKPEEEDAANIPWFDLAADQLLSDNDWWTRQQTIYQQMKKDDPEFWRRSAEKCNSAE